MRKISDIMNKNLVVINKETGLDEIIKIMKTNRIGKLPVIDENGEVLGVVTRDDILVREEKLPMQPMIAFWEVLISLPTSKEFQDKIKKMSSYKAGDLFSNNYYIATSNDNLEDVITEMLDNRYEYTLIIEDKKLIGIVTKSDLIDKCF
ncbi:MAG: CBS domain-containing protein [Fusobacteriaceae bacterium]